MMRSERGGPILYEQGRCLVNKVRYLKQDKAGVVGDATGPRPEQLGALTGQWNAINAMKAIHLERYSIVYLCRIKE